MPVLLGGLELQKHCCYFYFSLHNPKEGLEPLWPEIFRLAFNFFALCQDKRAVMLTSSRGHILAIFPPSTPASHHRDTEMSGRPCQC